MNRPLSLLLVMPGLLLSACSSAGEEAQPPPLVQVKVARVQVRDLDIQVGAPARVYPREQADIASRLTARIVRLEARKGDRVAAGQVLARLEDQDLVAQRDEAAAAVADAEATLAKVSSGTLPADLKRAQGKVSATRAALDQAQADYDRRSKLFDQGAIPKKDLIATETALATAKANAEVAAEELDLLKSQTGTRDVEIARSRLQQSRSRLAYLETQLNFATIHAPFAGTVTEQFVFPGDMAAPSTTLFTLADLSLAVARAQVPEGEVNQVRVGQTCSLAPVDQPDTSFSGRVSVVNSAVDPERRTVEVWCEIPNPDRLLRAGAFGDLSIQAATLTSVLVVPRAAVQFAEGSAKGSVMVVGKDRQAESREVQTGPSTETWISIRSGLEEGETVIVEGGYGLPDGTRVEWGEDPK